MKRTPLKRKTRLRSVNRRRQAKKYERNFGQHSDWIRSHACCACGRPESDTMTIQAAHAKARGMGGCGGDKTDLVPLCFDCHLRETEGHLIVAVVQFVPGTPPELHPTETIHLNDAAALFWRQSPHYEEST